MVVRKTALFILFLGSVASAWAKPTVPTLPTPIKPPVVWANPSKTPVWPTAPEAIKKISDLAVYPTPAAGNSFYEQEKERTSTLRELSYQESVLKLQTSILQLSNAIKIQQRMLEGKSLEDPAPSATHGDSKSPPPPPPPTMHVLALFLKGSQKSAELELNGDSTLVQEGQHIGDDEVERIDETGVWLSDSNHKVTHLILE